MNIKTKNYILLIVLAAAAIFMFVSVIIKTGTMF